MRTALLVPYFGPLPVWWPLFVESVKYNPSYTFFLFTDQNVDHGADNLVVIPETFSNYCSKIGQLLNFDFNPKNPYKLCDARPVFGHLHQELIEGFDFYGYCDVDLIFGRIDDFMPENPTQYRAISTHDRRTAGHFSIFKNVEKNRLAYHKIRNLQQLLTDHKHHGVDENHFSRIYYRHKSKPMWLRKLLFKFSWHTSRNYFKEQYTTPYTHNPWIAGSFEFPTEWYWKNGSITNNRDGNREFMYLHFMSLKSARFYPYAKQAPWETVDNLVNIPTTAAKAGFRIDLQGFHTLDEK
ncbi:Uncharacterised protein [BD1-7 clade bacterium]|uniref:Nucleotide-diphospho-sugar transferase domain-containing protein n=1 Tax=BD1-7 clade bacterium TaxID=2029982 RepID=A0A5S9N004_9GAMM|nr:Uncharacterised protein [BD1-7 clade bacterium]CAA0082802.1 Uncharacterised protein [BD1-7 clade bacterium]